MVKCVRTKLLLLLLVLTIVPMLLLSLADHWMIRNMGEHLARMVRAHLIEDAKHDLQQVVDAYSQVVEVERRLLDTLITLQAVRVENALASLPDEQGVYFFDWHFDQMPEKIPGLVPSSMHRQIGEDGKLEPVQVSFDVSAIRLLPGVEEKDVEKTLHRLMSLTVDMQETYEAHPNMLLWQYVTLEEGIHVAYPGKGGYPEIYEPRERSWYQQAKTIGQRGKAHRQTRWIAPIVDVATRQVLMTWSRPVYWPDGRFAGVTALDVPMSSVLSERRLPAHWAAYATIQMIMLQPAESTDQPDSVRVGQQRWLPVVVAEEHGVATQRDWRAQVTTPTLQLDRGEDMVQFVRDVHEARSAVRMMNDGGMRMLWAYAPINQNVSMLVRVPESRVIEHAEEVQDEVLLQMWVMIQYSTVALVAVIIMVLLIAWHTSSTVSRPILAMADAAKSIAGGDLKASVPLARAYKAGREFGELAESFNEMVPKLQDQMKMRESLDLAMEVQQSLLPAASPKIGRLEIAGHSDYCDETGGDYYDFLQMHKHSDHCIGVAVGDVVGHGVAAALLMATVRALLRSGVESTKDLTSLFAQVNHHLCESRFVGKFMTLYYLVIDTEQKQLRYVSAGHDPALVYFPKTNQFEELSGEDIPIGIDSNWTYHEATHPLWSEEAIIAIGTDGIWEARNKSGEMFGKQRLKDVISQANKGASANDICQAVYKAVEAFCVEAEQLDDITLVIIRVSREDM